LPEPAHLLQPRAAAGRARPVRVLAACHPGISLPGKGGDGPPLEVHLRAREQEVEDLPVRQRPAPGSGPFVAGHAAGAGYGSHRTRPGRPDAAGRPARLFCATSRSASVSSIARTGS
jgi:hypothetical protein